ncbi:MAG: ABC transporter permease [Synergistota bacterium]|nr:ABC transporter permease [Synergistota bacterium]
MKILEYIMTHQETIIDSIIRHFALFAVSMTFAIIAGIGLSILITSEGKERIGRHVLTITGASQAVPSVAVIAIAYLFVGIGVKPAIIALVLYSLVPVVFNATSGILSVPPGVIQAAKGMGLTRSQRLWRVKIPLCIPVIMSGIRSASTINIGTVTVAAIIGGGGLGDIIYTGLKLGRTDMIIVGAGFAALMAIAVDTVLQVVEKKITPRGLQY